MFSSSILANQSPESLASFSIPKSMLYSKTLYFKYFGKSESGELLNSKKQAILKNFQFNFFGKSEAGEFLNS